MPTKNSDELPIKYLVLLLFCAGEFFVWEGVGRGHVMRGAKTSPAPTHSPCKFSFSLFIEIVRETTHSSLFSSFIELRVRGSTLAHRRAEAVVGGVPLLTVLPRSTPMAQSWATRGIAGSLLGDSVDFCDVDMMQIYYLHVKEENMTRRAYEYKALPYQRYQ